MHSTSANPTFVDTIWTTENNMVRNAILAVLGTVALWISAKIQVPFYPVPMTMQTFVVLVIGMTFGWRLGAATLALYLAEGAVGLPVFAGTPERGIGLAYMAGPTGGYLVGFLVGAVVVGYLAVRGWSRHVGTTLAAMTLGTAIIFGFGYVWLGAMIGYEKAFAVGVAPFLYGAVFKIALAATVLPLAWRLVGNIRS